MSLFCFYLPSDVLDSILIENKILYFSLNFVKGRPNIVRIFSFESKLETITFKPASLSLFSSEPIAYLDTLGYEAAQKENSRKRRIEVQV